MRQRQPREKNERHLAWLRTLPSLVPGQGPVEAAHVRYGELRYFKPITGMAEKPSDKYAVPLAHGAHMDQHAHSERKWWEARRIDPILIACLLWLHSGNDEAGQHIVATAQHWALRSP